MTAPYRSHAGRGGNISPTPTLLTLGSRAAKIGAEGNTKPDPLRRGAIGPLGGLLTTCLAAVRSGAFRMVRAGREALLARIRLGSSATARYYVIVKVSARPGMVPGGFFDRPDANSERMIEACCQV